MIIKEKNIVINKVFNNDSRGLLKILKDSVKIKSTITSPPYFDMKDYGCKNQIGFGQSYLEYLNDLKKVFEDVFKITEEDGSLWIVIDTFKRDNQVIPLPFDLSSKLKEIGWLLEDIIIWKKDKTVPWSANGFMQRKFEYILFFTKSSNYTYNKDKVRNFDTDQLKKWWVKYPERYNPKGKALDEIWEFPIPVQGSWGKKYIRHFCPLPTEMVATMVDISTNENDIILDPFAGSGSVLFQSAVMKRNYIGFELNPDYIQMFQEYFESNINESKKMFNRLENSEGQDYFKNKILNLRALKFGRVLVNKVDKNLNTDLKVFVKIVEYLENSKSHIKVSYQFFGTSIDINQFNNIVEELINKPPLSKYGIIPIIAYTKEKEINRNDLYFYTKTNSYSHAKLPYDFNKIKVVSSICVDLNENDYI